MNLITDRTKSDVLLGTEKGRYTFSDLNRVESAVAELAPYFGLKLETKTDWGTPGVFSESQWPTESQMMRYKMNVAYLCHQLPSFPLLPTSMDNLNWEGANQIERALQMVADYVFGAQAILGRGKLGYMKLGNGGE